MLEGVLTDSYKRNELVLTEDAISDVSPTVNNRKGLIARYTWRHFLSTSVSILPSDQPTAGVILRRVREPHPQASSAKFNVCASNMPLNM